MSIAFHRSPFLPITIVPKRHVDSRGWFSETFHDERLRDLGIVCTFVQENQSRSSRKGTLRGFHFQEPPAAQAKLITDNGKQLFVPTGFAHGFVTLEDEVCVLYKVSYYHAPSREGGIRWNDPDIAFPWPSDETDIIRSERDQLLPLLKELESPFSYDRNPLMELPAFNFS